VATLQDDAQDCAAGQDAAGTPACEGVATSASEPTPDPSTAPTTSPTTEPRDKPTDKPTARRTGQPR